MKQTCNICRSDGAHPRYWAREMMFGTREEFAYFQCLVCECLQIETPPVNLAKYYGAGYYSYKPNAPETPLKRWLIRHRDCYSLTGRGAFGALLYYLYPNTKLLPLRGLRIARTDSILDVGCGAGLLLHALKELGFDHVLGIDPFLTSDIEYDNGLQIKRAAISDLNSKFDVIMLHHSFEHMSEPMQVLQSIAGRLRPPNGFCLLRIPIVPSLAWNKYGVNWAQLDAPRHLFLHSQKSIRLLCSQAGLKVHHVAYDSSRFQFWASEQYCRNISLNDPASNIYNKKQSPFTRQQLRQFDRDADVLNKQGRGDQAAFVLKLA